MKFIGLGILSGPGRGGRALGNQHFQNARGLKEVRAFWKCWLQDTFCTIYYGIRYLVGPRERRACLQQSALSKCARPEGGTRTLKVSDCKRLFLHYLLSDSVSCRAQAEYNIIYIYIYVCILVGEPIQNMVLGGGAASGGNLSPKNIFFVITVGY